MRLHFAAFRAAGCFEACPAFESYYVRFIGHFVSVYERAAPPFARNAARWSVTEGNFEEYATTLSFQICLHLYKALFLSFFVSLTRYVKRGRTWPDVTGISTAEAIGQLPRDERPENDQDWPYHSAYLA